MALTRQNSATADGALVAHQCKVRGFALDSDGTNSASAIFYDNASAASGTVLARLRAPATGSTSMIFKKAFQAEAGVYVDVTTGGSCFAQVFFD